MLSRTSPKELNALALLEAQALVERGWCQKALQTGDSFCLLGAIHKATTGDPANCDWERYGVAYEALWLAVGCSGAGDAVDWNNAPGRTQAEVVEAFGKAAELARVSA